MSIDPGLWPKLHGASVHFPIALAMAAALFDGAGFACPAASPHRARLLAAGRYALVLGALGTFPAVLSGLVMTRGEAMGHDLLRLHHLFVWPAFAGLVGLGTWRAAMDDRAVPRGFAAYLAALFLTVGLTVAGSYWGGEMMLNS